MQAQEPPGVSVSNSFAPGLQAATKPAARINPCQRTAWSKRRAPEPKHANKVEQAALARPVTSASRHEAAMGHAPHSVPYYKQHTRRTILKRVRTVRAEPGPPRARAAAPRVRHRQQLRPLMSPGRPGRVTSPYPGPEPATPPRTTRGWMRPGKTRGPGRAAPGRRPDRPRVGQGWSSRQLRKG